jgi:hypothetical protein
MTNFADDWSVRAMSESRQKMLRDEAYNHHIARSLRNASPGSHGLRYAVGVKLIRLGQYVLS